jgi:hypothetical protein
VPSPAFARRCAKPEAALQQIVISRLGRIGPVLSETEQAGIDEARVDCRNGLVVKLETRHRRRPDIVDQHVGLFDQPQQHAASRRLLQIEHDAALAAIGVEKHRPHAGVARRADLPGYVALRRFDLDDIGAVVAENLRRVRPHQHRRHVDDFDAFERSHSDPRIDAL